MKKRIVYLLLGSLLAISMSACKLQPVSEDGAQESVTEKTQETTEVSNSSVVEAQQESDNVDSKEETESEDESELDDKESKETDSDKNKTTSGSSVSGDAYVGELDYEAIKSVKELYFLERLVGGTKLLVVDADGKSYGWIDLEVFREEMKTRGYGFENAYISCISEGIAYVKSYVIDGEEISTKVYAIDLNTYEAFDVWTGSMYCNIVSIEYYDGAIHITVDEDRALSEYVVTKEKNALAFLTGGGQYHDVVVNYDSVELSGKQDSIRERYMGLSHCMDENGYVVVEENGQYRRVNSDGTTAPLAIKEQLSEEDAGWEILIEDYNQDYICFWVFRGGKERSYYLYETATDKAYPMSDKLSLSEVLGIVKGKLYFADNKSTEYGAEDNVICRSDLKTQTTENLYQVKDVPGADICAGTDNWLMLGDNIYYVGFTDGKITWFQRNMKDLEKEIDTGFYLEELSAFRYGKVNSISATRRCKGCQVVRNQAYVESFELDATYSAQAEKINASLKQKMEDAVSKLKEDCEPEDEIACERHKRRPYDACVYKESLVDDVRILSDKYLTIDSTESLGDLVSLKFELYDLTTGDELTMRDLYKGTEEEFKELVAQKTKEDSKTHMSPDGYFSVYYNREPEEIYQDALKQVSLDGKISFHQDGIYYNYALNSMGMGYVDVFISYQDLLGRPEL